MHGWPAWMRSAMAVTRWTRAARSMDPSATLVRTPVPVFMSVRSFCIFPGKVVGLGGGIKDWPEECHSKARLSDEVPLAVMLWFLYFERRVYEV